MALLGLLSAIFLPSPNKTDVFEKVVLKSLSLDPLDIERVEITPYQENSPLFLAVIAWREDWWEKLEVGKNDKNIIWLKMDMPPTEQSIRSAKFLNLKGFNYPILEVYGETHMGHGNLYLYKVLDGKLSLIFKTPAVDYYPEYVWNPENYKRYGYGTCSRKYQNGQLYAKYDDINNDGKSDLVLEGKMNLSCEEEITENMAEFKDIQIAEIPVQKIFFWNEIRQTFLNCDLTSYESYYPCL